jgi:hypothetical protein
MKASLTNRLRRVQPGATWPSLARIGAWAIVWFLILGISAPFIARVFENDAYNNRVNVYNTVAGMRQNAAVQIVSPSRNDISGFVAEQSRDDDFTIAWIAGSSIQSIGEEFYTFVPAEVQPLMSEVDGRPTTIDVYFLSGIRIVDIYFAVLETLETDPDLIVITWNPLWVLNNTANHDWSELDPEIVRTALREPSSLTLVAGYLSPGDIALGTASAMSDAVRYRSQTAAAINRSVLEWSPFTREFATEPATEPLDELDRIRQMNIPVAFWRTYRQAPVQGQSLAERQLQFILDSTLDDSTINADVIRRIGQLTADQDTPLYTYMAPIKHSALAEPEIDAALAEIEAAVASLRVHYPEPFQSFNTTSLSRIVESFAFNDIIHLGEVGPVAEYLAGDICEHLASLGRECSRPVANLAASQDFDGNGASDVFAVLSDGIARFALGAESLWSVGVELNSTDPAELAFGDFNGDGTTDLLRIHNNTYEYSPSATKPWQPLQPATTPLANTRLGDFNGDGTTDLLELRRSQTEPKKLEWFLSIAGTGDWQLRAASTTEPVMLLDGN